METLVGALVLVAGGLEGAAWLESYWNEGAATAAKRSRAIAMRTVAPVLVGVAGAWIGLDSVSPLRAPWWALAFVVGWEATVWLWCVTSRWHLRLSHALIATRGDCTGPLTVSHDGDREHATQRPQVSLRKALAVTFGLNTVLIIGVLMIAVIADVTTPPFAAVLVVFWVCASILVITGTLVWERWFASKVFPCE